MRVQNVCKHKPDCYDSVFLALLAGIVITNFYGFSVVVIGILFFLLPALVIVRKRQRNPVSYSFGTPLTHIESLNWVQVVLGSFVLVGSIFFLVSINNLRVADEKYNLAKSYLDQGNILQANKNIDEALLLNSSEAYYYLQKALITSQAALAISHKDASDSAGLVKELTKQAVQYNQAALLQNPVHLNLYKSAAKVYITLGVIDAAYFKPATEVLKLAAKLSPTDPQLPVNLGLLAKQQHDLAQAEIYLKQAVELKPNYHRAWLYLAETYEEEEKTAEAIETYTFILKNINSKDQTSLDRLAKLQKQ